LDGEVPGDCEGDRYVCVSGRQEGDGRGSLLSPETGLTNIWTVEAGSGETERDDGIEDRMMVVCLFV